MNGKAGLPESVTIRFQSGIAKDTLVFGSIHKADGASLTFISMMVQHPCLIKTDLP